MPNSKYKENKDNAPTPQLLKRSERRFWFSILNQAFLRDTIIILRILSLVLSAS